ncbi:MAG: hypothetical protein JW966_14170 [Anaerolineae bacterium]|nr:hypothetical protein [Anaerolineae bacterium]
MNNTDRSPEHDEVEYIGAPTEYADAQEAPEWLQMLVKALVAIPAGLAALTGLQLILLAVLFACIVACVLFTSIV